MITDTITRIYKYWYKQMDNNRCTMVNHGGILYRFGVAYEQPNKNKQPMVNRAELNILSDGNQTH